MDMFCHWLETTLAGFIVMEEIHFEGDNVLVEVALRMAGTGSLVFNLKRKSPDILIKSLFTYSIFSSPNILG